MRVRDLLQEVRWNQPVRVIVHMNNVDYASALQEFLNKVLENGGGDLTLAMVDSYNERIFYKKNIGHDVGKTQPVELITQEEGKVSQ